ncbi:MAG: hypothetical protein DRJ65_15490 [Acidobacteria bacterium]|nr:MAG: hypothetical protein DRJ65_15490 [Acidobacteriota bacterium]
MVALIVKKLRAECWWLKAYLSWVILTDEMCQSLEALASEKNVGIPEDLLRLFEEVQGPRGWCRSPLRIAQLR